MSSSTAPDVHNLFVVQSGVVAWEDPEPILDWRWKTVSVCAARLSLLVTAFWAIVTSRPPSLPSVFRFHTGSVPTGASIAHRRQFMNALRKDAPGFGATHVATADSHVCVASRLVEPAHVDLNYLSSYRSSLLVEADSSVASSADLCQAFCAAATDLGGAGIARLLDRTTGLAVVRVVEQTSHAAIQLIGSPDTSVRAAHALTDLGVRRLHDVRTLPMEIARLRG